jgi:hypothetical protein
VLERGQGAGRNVMFVAKVYIQKDRDQGGVALCFMYSVRVFVAKVHILTREDRDQGGVTRCSVYSVGLVGKVQE